jgi:hypothetical protein
VMVESCDGVHIVESVATHSGFVHSIPGLPTRIYSALAQKEFGQPAQSSHRVRSGVFAGTHQFRTASKSASGTVTAVISPNRSSRLRCAGSRASVLIRSPLGRSNFDGAATTQSMSAPANAQPESRRPSLVAPSSAAGSISLGSRRDRTPSRPFKRTRFYIHGMRHYRKRMYDR